MIKAVIGHPKGILPEEELLSSPLSALFCRTLAWGGGRKRENCSFPPSLWLPSLHNHAPAPFSGGSPPFLTSRKRSWRRRSVCLSLSVSSSNWLPRGDTFPLSLFLLSRKKRRLLNSKCGRRRRRRRDEEGWKNGIRGGTDREKPMVQIHNIVRSSLPKKGSPHISLKNNSDVFLANLVISIWHV